MTPLLQHLLESTVFAVVVWLATLALRRNHARSRHLLWMAASVKFLIPFSVFVALGTYTVRQPAAPVPVPPQPGAVPREPTPVPPQLCPVPWPAMPLMPMLPEANVNSVAWVVTSIALTVLKVAAWSVDRSPASCP